MLLMRPSLSGVLAPAGKEWCFEFPVGVDCSGSEPRCIWLAALRNHVQIPRNMRAKGQREGILQSTQNAAPGSRENVAWKGPRTVVLQKNSQGFGFTLRHFIVYPPESALHTSFKDVENGNGKGNGKGRLEPMDTIFVKNVRETGPAHQAGLCTGDRLVKVNGESILGKTYSQVISLIQNSETVLELSIMPKDEDVLQLAYSQDAYLKGNDPYTGGAQNLPEPPPVCYSANKPSSSSPAPTYVAPDNLNCRRGSSGLIESWSTGDNQGVARWHALRHHRSRSSTIAISPLDFHFANHNAAMATASLPHPRKGSLPHSHRELCQQALSNWYHSQTLDQPATPISAHHRSISQDALLLHCEPPVKPTPPSHPDLQWTRRGGTSAAGRSCSENLLSDHSAYRQSYGCSLDILDHPPGLIAPHERPAWPPQSSQPIRKDDQPSSTGQHAVASTPAPHSGRNTSTAPPKCLPAQTIDDQMVGYRSYSPSFCRKAGHLLQQAHSFREPSYTGPHLNWTSTPKTSPAQSAPSSVRDSSPLTLPSTTETPSTVREDVGGGAVVEESVLAQIQGVVLRQKPLSGKRNPQALRHPNYAVPVDLPKPQVASAPAAPLLGDPTKRSNGNLQPLPVEQDSLASIPFIDDPISPGMELLAQHVPASSVVSSSVCQTPPVSSSPVTPSSTFPPLTQLRHSDSSSKFKRHSFKDWHLLLRNGNVKNSRRSSYLLAITTERSKSCDEGLNTFRDEGRRFSRLPKRVKSFFTESSLESLRAAEEARSKRHSTSELGNITLTDIRKEGWLHYKQILTEKGKKVGGGMRPWKRVFSVLRTHSLFLYKDKREAVLHGAGALGPGAAQAEDEQPISIRGCLIDIAYSETKRKHTLRLTTQDFCEYLLQAEDRDDMLSWIRVIRENSKTDSEELGFSGQALINKKLNDYRKQSLTGTKPDTSPRVHRMMQPFLLSKMENTPGVNRFLKSDSKDDSSPPKAPWSINIMKKGKKAGPKAFGVRLEDCSPGANNKFVPLIVETCCSLVEEMGLENTGIYRVPGNNAMVSSLQDQLNKGMDINTAEERWQDLNVISSLLKSFFRKLPEPLFTDDKYNDFIYANRLEDAGDRLKTMRKLIRDLPDRYYHTLKFLVGHLKRVADHSEKNKMEPRNLALVFGPTLVRTSEDNMTDMVTHMPDRYKIVETLILHYAWFFSDDLNKDEKAPEDQRDEQPIPNIDHLLSNIGRTAGLGDTPDFTNSDSVKNKGSLTLKKDASAKDFLPLSIISAVTRKRKKQRSASPTDSSSDEDSELEPIKASNYGEMRESAGETGEGSRERGTSERSEGQEGGADQKFGEEKSLSCLESCEDRGQEDVERRKGAAHYHEEDDDDGARPESDQEKPQRPRSFLYSHQNSLGLRVTVLSDRSPSPPCSSPGSGSTQRLGQANPTGRKKLRGDRARPRSLYEDPGLERTVGLARVKASLIRGQERLRQAMSPSREPSVQHSWLSQVQANLLSSANDMWRSGAQRRHASPETRRRRRDWRRHTVVGNGGEG